MESPLMNVKETADYLHVGKSTVYKLEADGVLHRVNSAGTSGFPGTKSKKPSWTRSTTVGRAPGKGSWSGKSPERMPPSRT